MSEISKHILDTLAKFKSRDKNIRSAKDLNTNQGVYNCNDLVTEVKRKVPEATQVSGMDHTFLHHGGRYYDAEAPHGVNHPNDLPHYKRSPRKWESLD